MKLSPELVERTLSQFDAQALPEDHPSLPELNRLFGEHTFFVGRNWSQHRGARRGEETSRSRPERWFG